MSVESQPAFSSESRIIVVLRVRTMLSRRSAGPSGGTVARRRVPLNPHSTRCNPGDDEPLSVAIVSPLASWMTTLSGAGGGVRGGPPAGAAAGVAAGAAALVAEGAGEAAGADADADADAGEPASVGAGAVLGA